MNPKPNPYLEKALPSLGAAFKAAMNDDYWEHPRVIGLTNCYAYALNQPCIGFAIPGRLASSGEDHFKSLIISAENMALLLKKDGLIAIGEEEALSKEGHIIALRLQPNHDYHFLRRDSLNSWSHKFGQASRSFEDNDGNSIINPRTASFKNYQVFAGYYELPKDGISYMPWLEFDDFDIAV